MTLKESVQTSIYQTEETKRKLAGLKPMFGCTSTSTSLERIVDFCYEYKDMILFQKWLKRMNYRGTADYNRRKK